MIQATSIAVALAAITAPPCASLAGDPVALAWKAPRGCPTRDQVLAEVRRLLGAHAEGARPIDARAEIARAGPSNYRLEIALRAGEGERAREVRAPTCAELGDAAALIIALAIDPSGALAAQSRDAGPSSADSSAAPAGTTSPAQQPASSSSSSGAPSASAQPSTSAGPAASAPPSTSPETTSSAQPPPTRPPEASASAPPVAPASSPPMTWSPTPVVAPRPIDRSPSPSPGARSARVVRVHAAIAGDVGTFPDPAPMVRAGAALVVAPLRFEIAGLFAWTGPLASPQSPSKGGEFWRPAGELSACYERRLNEQALRSLALAACAGLEGGAIIASSYGVTSPGWGAAPWLAPTASGLFRWSFARRAALRVDLGIAVPLLRPAFVIAGLGPVLDTGAVAGQAAAGLEVDLGRL